MADDPIALYAAKAPDALAAVCELLQAQIKRALPQVDVKALRRWLKLAGTQIWDYKGTRAG